MVPFSRREGFVGASGRRNTTILIEALKRGAAHAKVNTRYGTVLYAVYV